MLVNSPLTVRLPRHYHRFCLIWTIILQPFVFLGVPVVNVCVFSSSLFSFSEADALMLLFELQYFTLLFALNAFSARHFEPAFVASAWCHSEKRAFFSKNS